jgi:hypothetical protein
MLRYLTRNSKTRAAIELKKLNRAVKNLLISTIQKIIHINLVCSDAAPRAGQTGRKSDSITDAKIEGKYAVYFCIIKNIHYFCPQNINRKYFEYDIENNALSRVK